MRVAQWHWLLVLVFLHEVVVQSKELDDSGRTCEDQEDRDGYAGGNALKDVRGSLLQVKKTKPSEPSPVSEQHIVESRSGTEDMLTEDMQGAQLAAQLESQINRISAAAVAKIQNWTGRRLPSFFILVLVFLIVVVVLLILFSFGVEQTESRGIGEEGRVEKVKGHGYHNATLLPSTNTVRSAPPSLQSLRHQGTPMATLRHLSPGLVVPHGNECILAVPFLPSTVSPGRQSIPLVVQDFEGASVIQADVVMPQSARASDPHHPFLMLRAGPQSRSHILAYCKCGHDFATRKIAYIHDGQDQLFAQISQDFSNRYILSANHVGLQYGLEGTIQQSAVRVTNADQRIMAETSSESVPFNASRSFYKLRVAGNVDVGLILCALFSMDFLERS